MASIEIEVGDAIPRLETSNGRRVVVIGEARLVLPDDDPWGASLRLRVGFERIESEVRADSRHDAHRGGRVIAASAPAGDPLEPAEHGPGAWGPGAWLSGSC